MSSTRKSQVPTLSDLVLSGSSAGADRGPGTESRRIEIAGNTPRTPVQRCLQQDGNVGDETKAIRSDGPLASRSNTPSIGDVKKARTAQTHRRAAAQAPSPSLTVAGLPFVEPAPHMEPIPCSSTSTMPSQPSLGKAEDRRPSPYSISGHTPTGNTPFGFSFPDHSLLAPALGPMQVRPPRQRLGLQMAGSLAEARPTGMLFSDPQEGPLRSSACMAPEKAHSAWRQAISQFLSDPQVAGYLVMGSLIACTFLI